MPAARTYGDWARYRSCPEWRAECLPGDDYWRDRDFRGGCYYRPADPPLRHKWRPRGDWPPEKHAWREAPEPMPPPPARRPKLSSDEAGQDVAPASGDDTAAGDSGEPDGTAETPETAEMTARQGAAANGEIPERYRRMRNRVGHTITAVRAGASLYGEHCAACHGDAGEGNGPRAQEVGPRIPALPYTLAQDHSTDTYLIWTIMQGGAPFGTDKPAFEDKLSAQQAWRIIAYMRAGFPVRGPSQAVRQTMRTQGDGDGRSADR